ncbi:hypothetical protein AYO37_01020 [Opitutia bacterium SCGC AG-212-L18]|nr:hypothetical protein AYO37_01020 [Opitutae bacterium SCGC AG-212-L18]
MGLNLEKSNNNGVFIFQGKYSKIKTMVPTLGLTFITGHALLLYIYLIHPISKFLIYLNIPIELIAIAISVPLFLEKLWPKTIQFIKPFYWVTAIGYLLPFWTSWMFLKNQGLIIWEILLLISFAILTFLTPFILLPPMIIIGCFLSYILYLHTTVSPIITADLSIILCIGILIVAYFMFFEKKREDLIEEKFNVLKSLGGSIAHELRTPIFSMIYGIRGLKKNLPSLFEGYELAEKHYLLSNKIDHTNLEILKDCQNSLEKSANEALVAIDMFLLRLKGTTSIKKEYHYIHTLIKSAIDEYPFIEKDKKLINLRLSYDFRFKGNPILIKYIIFNLIKNSVYQINMCKKGDITIGTEFQNGIKLVRFKDTAGGIPKHVYGEIFEKFYTNKESGSGLGLSFCKLAMEEMNGSIECNSEENEYTEFMLKF